jgi:hypothetical protein
VFRTAVSRLGGKEQLSLDSVGKESCQQNSCKKQMSVDSAGKASVMSEGSVSNDNCQYTQQNRRKAKEEMSTLSRIGQLSEDSAAKESF